MPNEEEMKKIIVEEIGIQHLSKDEQGKIVADLSELLMEQAIVAVMSHLSEEEFDRVDKLLEAGDQDAVRDTIVELVPNAPEIVNTTVKLGLDKYKELVADNASG